MDVIKFYTGQGVTCDLGSVGLYTGQFSSCSPIVLYNHGDGRGGMYHLPGGGGRDGDFKEYWGTIEAMVEDVDPTWVGLFPTGYGDPSMLASASLSLASRPRAEDITGDRDKLKIKFEALMASRGLYFIVEVHPEGRSGIFVRVGLGGLEFASMFPDKANIVDVKTRRNNLPSGCTLYNPDIDYSDWV